MYKNDFVKKIKLISKFMSHRVNKQLQYTYCPISQDIKEMKFRQWNLVSYWSIKWETFFLKNHKQNVVEKDPFPDLFLKNQNLAYILINTLKVLYSLFLLYAKLRAVKIYWNQAADHLFFPHTKLCFLNTTSGTSLPASFFEWLLKENIYLLY